MPVNSRNKGASFERSIATLLVGHLLLEKPVKRILEQTRTKQLPDLRFGRWNIECKRYAKGAELKDAWWDQVMNSCKNGDIPALIYKFDYRPVKVRVLAKSLNPVLSDERITVDLSFGDFIYLLETLYQEDIRLHEEKTDV